MGAILTIFFNKWIMVDLNSLFFFFLLFLPFHYSSLYLIMDFFSLSFESTIIISQILRILFSSGHFFKDMLKLLLSYTPLSADSHADAQDSETSSQNYNTPSPLFVPVPVHCVIESLKDQLRVVEYTRLLDESKATKEGDSQCAVCLNIIGEEHEVRELGNCCHVFHKECIDVWMDQGQATCPLCRSKLLPAAADEHGRDEMIKNGGGPWRRERMIYLFGEDYVMG